MQSESDITWQTYLFLWINCANRIIISIKVLKLVWIRSFYLKNNSYFWQVKLFCQSLTPNVYVSLMFSGAKTLFKFCLNFICVEFDKNWVFQKNSLAHFAWFLKTMSKYSDLILSLKYLVPFSIASTT